MDTTIPQAYEGACPNCGAIWGMEEVDCNYCAACGWPDNYEQDYDEDDEYYENEEIATCGCGFCNCSNTTVVGEVCNMCLRGEHQG